MVVSTVSAGSSYSTSKLPRDPQHLPFPVLQMIEKMEGYKWKDAETILSEANPGAENSLSFIYRKTVLYSILYSRGRVV